ncbi:hypothetical protein SAMN02982929_06430 [Saccharopolyspora kobensis]|uniref:Uncharacterized protein n=1 Tax=Saccharopolyspora kobensis TaxID=146035 RepID=A0A1H6EFC6_9PSEU|nr:hypothetical protein [Saccharopolyspora kobensis]SEG96462.1 hypothetical protein SAMN02982929_06430 [Saccharopolyspora kobensis]SFF07488.1 hypothetical protein SAMN05216506_118118 [Saccharopolyspora kobensis]
MDPELAALASSAANTLVESLTTSAWQQAKNGLGALWRRVHPDRAETVEAEFDDAREEALAAIRTGDEETGQALTAEWRSRLRRLLNDDPEIATELIRLIEDLRAAPLEGNTQVGTMYGRASEHGKVYQAGRDMHFNER